MARETHARRRRRLIVYMGAGRRGGRRSPSRSSRASSSTPKSTTLVVVVLVAVHRRRDVGVGIGCAAASPSRVGEEHVRERCSRRHSERFGLQVDVEGELDGPAATSSLRLFGDVTGMLAPGASGQQRHPRR